MEESEEFGVKDSPEMGNGKPINSESIRETAAKIDEKLLDNPKDKALKKTILPAWKNMKKRRNS